MKKETRDILQECIEWVRTSDFPQHGRSKLETALEELLPLVDTNPLIMDVIESYNEWQNSEWDFIAANGEWWGPYHNFKIQRWETEHPEEPPVPRTAHFPIHEALQKNIMGEFFSIPENEGFLDKVREARRKHEQTTEKLDSALKSLVSSAKIVAICPECGTEFTPINSRQIYDKDVCLSRARQKRYRKNKKALQLATPN